MEVDHLEIIRDLISRNASDLLNSTLPEIASSALDSASNLAAEDKLISQNWFYMVIVCPMAVLVGFGAATAAASAWNLIVPVLFVLFKFSVFSSLLISVCMDCINGVVLTIYYGFYHNKIDAKYAAMFSIYTMIIAVVFAESFADFIMEHESKLRGGVGFVPFVLSFTFLTRGCWLFYKNRKARLEKEGREEQERQGLINSEDPNSEADEESTPVGVVDEEKAEPEEEEVELDYTKGAHTPPTWSEYLIELISWKSPIIMGVKGRFFWLRMTLSLILTSIMGVFCGLLYFGGGIGFSSTILSFWGGEVKQAAGTGTVIMSATMFAIGLTFFGRDLDTPPSVLTARLLPPVLCTAIGTAIGAKFAMKVNEVTVYFCVFAIMLTMGIISTVEAYYVNPSS
eukprot:TRINITY_DN11079_c0_g1_i1.p1 TRINITY_DN11079_c0_g1~~TRINITY_DN11079_c0_g1_i1.p1  ORF type:complete len:398 (+),score=122.16 TRINITY_DN11079_c0_g1_i1:87-1280(+)